MSPSSGSLTRVRRTAKPRIDSYGFAGGRRQGCSCAGAPFSHVTTTHEVFFTCRELCADRSRTAGARAVPLELDPEPTPASTKPNNARRISRSATPGV